MNKKKKVAMPSLEKNSLSFKTKLGILAIIAFGIGCVVFAAIRTKNCVEKNVVNQYVCKIVGSDAEAEMIAVECLTK